MSNGYMPNSTIASYDKVLARWDRSKQARDERVRKRLDARRLRRKRTRRAIVN
jgi:hypothetical protein